MPFAPAPGANLYYEETGAGTPLIFAHEYATDQRGWQEYRTHLLEHSALGAALTMQNYQGKRRALQEYEAEFSVMQVPTLLVIGDEDDPVIETNLFLKRTLPRVGLWMLPKTGHGVNLEEPGRYNQGLLDFFGAVERGGWGPRSDAGQNAY